VFSYHLEYDIREESGPPKLRVAWDVPEGQLLEMQSSHRAEVAVALQQQEQQQQGRRQQRRQRHLGEKCSWVSKLKEGDQVFHERCCGNRSVCVSR
ncbi:unnamed protein product, partial [Polarella glacialis]